MTNPFLKRAQAPLKIRDRIKELRRVKASELIPNPKNWRTHPDEQREVLVDLLGKHGYVAPLLARETPEGLMLLDGHARRELTPDAVVPVAVLDITEEEEAMILATFDPVTALAEADAEVLGALLQGMQTESEAVAGLLEKIAVEEKLLPKEKPEKNPEITETWQVVVTCKSEADQLALIEDLTGRGYECRALTV